MSGDLGLPYGKHTPQVEGRRAEKRMARERGARLHPMSGAGSIKDDASTEAEVFEFKNANKTHTLNADDLYKLMVRALRAEKEPYYVIQFANGVTATIHLSRDIRG